MTDLRRILISNLNRDTASDLNNDIQITLPDSLISGKLQAANLQNLYISYETETIGTSNYQFNIQYPSSANSVTITLDIHTPSSGIITTDEQLADLIASSINNTLGVNVFNAYFNNIIIYNDDVYRDNSNLLANYTIYTINSVDFNLDFSSITSIGPLIGFGNNLFTNQNSYTSGNIPPIYAYESIRISNSAFNASLSLYDQYIDLNCKMNLYDSNNNLIPNYLNIRDTTISLPIVHDYIYEPAVLINYLTTEINRYSSSFDSDTEFIITYNFTNYTFNITTSTNVKFGIGFRFNNNGNNNYGSLHRVLGFQKRNYLGVTSITSIKSAEIFGNSYYNDYLLICSDLIIDNFDASILVAGSNSSSSLYPALFTIPLSSIVNNNFTPLSKDNFRIRIHASKLAKLYNENLANPKTINFYLRSSTGRHIKLNTQWVIELELEYSN
jgi:hypothetical protein